MKTPNLFIVGAPKCGTTAWVSYLSQHPGISFCDAKEPHYFSDDLNFRWVKDEGEYMKGFSTCDSSSKYISEASVMYLYSSSAAENIRKFNPDAKIIVFLRDWRSFLPSYHQQQVYNGDETEKDFNQACRLAKERRKGSKIPTGCREPKLLDYPEVAKFGKQLSRYKLLWPDSQIKVLQFEEWKNDPSRYYDEVLGFLGLERKGGITFDRVNASRSHRAAWLGRLTQNPPAIVLNMLGVLKKLLRVKRLKISHLLRRFNTRSGVKKSQMAETTEEYLAAELKEDRKLLGGLLSK